MNIIIILFLILIILAVITTFADFVVMGGLLKARFLDKYFTPERLEKYKKNGCNGDLIYGLGMPYISTLPVGVLSKWYISGLGQIPRWSRWHKRINELHEEILTLP